MKYQKYDWFLYGVITMGSLVIVYTEIMIQWF